MKQTHARLNSKNLTPQEFITLQKDAIDAYNAAVYMLADILKLGKEKFGRKQLMELTPFPLTKVQWFVAIASITHRNPKTLPELVVEVVNVPNANQWLKRAISENWSPLQLRKAIREKQRAYKKVAPLKNVAEYPRLMDQVERELKRLPSEERVRAQVYVAKRVQELS